MSQTTDAADERQYSAFISHASADREAAETIARSLEAKGLTCWIAPRDVPPGAEYGEAIVRGIRRSKCLILVLSEAANLSAMVRREVERAASNGKPIYPIRIEEVVPSPKLEFFVSMNHWIDAWDGVLDEHAGRLAAAVDSEEEWTGNRLLRRRRLYLSGAAASLLAAVVIALAVVFGGDIRTTLLSPQERARQALTRAGVQVDVQGLARAAVAADADRLALFDAAGLGAGALTDAFTQAGVARRFFEASKASDRAIDWFRGALKDRLDPNLAVPDEVWDRQGMLHDALGVGNFRAAMALLEAGASPHVFEDLWFVHYRSPAMLFPYDDLVDNERLTRDEKAAVAEAFVAAGALLPALSSDHRLDKPPLARLSATRAAIRDRLGVEVPPVGSICDAGQRRVCATASARDGFDWCDFAATLPRALRPKDERSAEVVGPVELMGLINVVDDRAYVMSWHPAGVATFRPGLGLVEISRDSDSWNVYHHTGPGAGLGFCDKDSNGRDRDNCWRRVPFDRSGPGGTMRSFGHYDYDTVQCGG